MAEPCRILLSCEHGGNRVPGRYRPFFAGHEALLETHRGYDIGILPLARFLARGLGVPLQAAGVTRLLVDLNRSLHSPTLFSEVTRPLPAAQREDILRRYYHPYRRRFEELLRREMESGGRVVHLSVHSFTPVLHGVERRSDVGLLYDPGRLAEADFCLRWQERLARDVPFLRVRRNYPYRGISDSLVSSLRGRFAAEKYLGLELEINQKIPQGDPGPWRILRQALVASLRAVAGGDPP